MGCGQMMEVTLHCTYLTREIAWMARFASCCRRPCAVSQKPIGIYPTAKPPNPNEHSPAPDWNSMHGRACLALHFLLRHAKEKKPPGGRAGGEEGEGGKGQT